jgi:hypothetical protein
MNMAVVTIATSGSTEASTGLVGEEKMERSTADQSVGGGQEVEPMMQVI